MSILKKITEWASGAKTIHMGRMTASCPICGNTECYSAMHVSASGAAEMIVIKCPKCGEIKRLYSHRPEPRFRKQYAEFIIGESKNPPKLKKEV